MNNAERMGKILNIITIWLHSLEGTKWTQVFLMVWLIAPFGLILVISPIAFFVHPLIGYIICWFAGVLFFTMTLLLFLWILTSE